MANGAPPLRVRAAARLAGVSVDTIRKYADNGVLDVVYLGRERRIVPESLDNLFTRKQKSSPEAVSRRVAEAARVREALRQRRKP